MSAALVLVLLGASPTETCRDAYDRLDFESACTRCATAISVAPPQQLAGLYRLLGLSYATIGSEEQAYAAFVSYLTLDPAAELSSTLSPKLRTQFLRAKSSGAGAEVHLHPEALPPVRVGQPLHLSIAVEDGPAAPIHDVRAEGTGTRAATLRGRGPVALELPAPTRAGPLTLSLAGVDRFGGALVSNSWTIDVAPRTDPRPLLLSWKVWGVCALVLAGLATGASIYAHAQGANAARAPTAASAHDAFVRESFGAYSADVGWSVGGAAALGAGWLLVTDPAREP